MSEEGKLLGGLDIGDILNEALGEDDVDFLERSVGSLCSVRYCSSAEWTMKLTSG